MYWSEWKLSMESQTQTDFDNPREDSIYCRALADGREIVLYQMLFAACICIGAIGEPEYDGVTHPGSWLWRPLKNGTVQLR